MGVRLSLLALTLACAFSNSGCGQLKMGAAIKRLNASAPKDALPPAVPAAERVARAVARQFSDSYYRPDIVGRWLEATARDPQPLLDLVQCIDDARQRGRSAAACQAEFSAPQGPLSSLGLPATRPPTETTLNDPALLTELDAERFIANGRLLAAALSELGLALGGVLPNASAGVAVGARRASAYLAARRWHRGERPTTALVLGGGSANGAFSAGFVWRLMEVMTRCRRMHAQGCPKARLDLVAGSSTGTLIGALVDLFFTKGHESEAMGLLMDNYTCSVEADLYCVPDEYFWKVVHDARGLVRFDGIASKIDRFITPAVEQNALELVGVTVDLGYGEVIGFSDQDPLDATIGCGRRNALLASIVLPVMAEPVDAVELRRGPRQGPFVDGGVSSIVPMLEAVRRGAERVVVLSNYPMDPEPAPAPRNAFDILTRTLELAMLFPGTSEIEHGELVALSRRLVEYHVCRERFTYWAGSSGAPTPEDFCRRKFGNPGEHAATVQTSPSGSSWRGALSFQEVENAFRSAWVFRTGSSFETAQGYAFDPSIMRPLFMLGVDAFQKRCSEILDVLAIHGDIAQRSCSEVSANERIARLFKPMDRCSARELRECRAPISCSRR